MLPDYWYINGKIRGDKRIDSLVGVLIYALFFELTDKPYEDTIAFAWKLCGEFICAEHEASHRAMHKISCRTCREYRKVNPEWVTALRDAHNPKVSFDVSVRTPDPYIVIVF